MTTATDTMTHHLPCASRTKLAGANDKKEEPLPPSRLIAPLHIPFERRLQMGSIAVWLSCSLSCSALFLAFWTHSFWFPLALVYLAYIYLDRATPNQGGRRIQTVREWPLWKYLADYFPVKVIKEHDLDPSGNYLFGYHPHGILSFGFVSLFATEGSGFSRLFPGVIPSAVTIPLAFFLPFYRDLVLSMGFCPPSRQSLENVLQSGPGRSVAIVLGGAGEALVSTPGSNRLILKKRLGFVRLAIRQQASLVPVFSFGETDVYDQYQLDGDSVLDTVRSLLKRYCGISFPLFYGRGLFNYDFGLVPYRKPITIIVGHPITMPQLNKDQVEPTKEQVLEVQELYIKALTGLYDKYKDIYAKDREQDLEIIA